MKRNKNFYLAASFLIVALTNHKVSLSNEIELKIKKPQESNAAMIFDFTAEYRKYGDNNSNYDVVPQKPTVIQNGETVKGQVVSGGVDNFVINKGAISYDGNEAAKADNGGTFINDTTGVISNNGNIGMIAWENGNLINHGLVENTGEMGIWVFGENASAANYGTVANGSAIGMRATNRSTAINHGTVVNNGNEGMKADDGGTAINETSGKISNAGEIGMIAWDSNSTIINRGEISNSGNIGMLAWGNATATNYGTIMNGGSEGMKADNGATAINRGIIQNNGESAMLAIGGGSTAINDVDGIINRDGNNQIGMLALDGGTAINKGTINVNGDSGVGIYALGGRAENYGTINLNGSSGTGIKINDTGSFVNSGTINLSGTSADGGITDSKGNIAIDNNGILQNKGVMVVDGVLDITSMGNGKLVMDKEGTISASEIKGDLYAGGGITLGSYEDKYVSSNAIKTENIEGDIISGSAMFDAALEKQEDGAYDIVMERKEFKDIVADSSFAEYLENNYAENNSQARKEYYEALKLISGEEKLNTAVSNSLGESYFPNLARLSFGNMRYVNDILKNSIRKRDFKKENSYLIGVDYSKSDNSDEGSLTGYRETLKSFALGADKKLNSNLVLGGAFSYANSSAEFSNGLGSRDAHIYQGTLYSILKRDGLTFTGQAYVGNQSQDLSRVYSFTSLYSETEADADNLYGGISANLEKEYAFGKLYLIPNGGFNLAVNRQDKIEEKGSQYAIEIKDYTSTLLEGNVGVTVGKKWRFTEKAWSDLSFSNRYFYEFTNPYEDLEARVSSISGDYYGINGYDQNRFYGDLGAKFEVTDGSLGIYAEALYIFGKKENEWIYKVGANYIF